MAFSLPIVRNPISNCFIKLEISNFVTSLEYNSNIHEIMDKKQPLQIWMLIGIRIFHFLINIPLGKKKSQNNIF